MNYILVTFTLVVLALTMLALAYLGTERLFPARKMIDYVSNDGLAVEENQNMPLVLSSAPSAEEITKIRFSTSLAGYNKDEVDAVLQKLIAENNRLRLEREV